MTTRAPLSAAGTTSSPVLVADTAGAGNLPTSTSGPNGGTWRMAVAMILSGTIGLLVVESGLPVLWVVWLRCLIGGVGLFAWVCLSKQWRRPTRSEWGWLALGGLSLVLNWLCLFRAYHYSSIAVSTVVYHVQPFLLLLLAALFQGEKLSLRRLPWLVLALLGVVFSSGLDLSGGGVSHWWGVGLALLAATLYAVATLSAQHLKRIAPAQIAMLQMALGGIVLALPAWSTAAQGFAVTPRGWLAVLILGVVHTAWMYTLMYAAFQRLSAQAIAGLSFIYPVVALLVDLLWFGAVPQPLQWLGMALIVVAVVMYRRAQNKV